MTDLRLDAALTAAELVAEPTIRFVDFRFVDLLGNTQHLTVPHSAVTVDMLHDGLPFDGSSVRGFTAIHQSDMKLMPDLSTAVVDPFIAARTVAITCDIADPYTGQSFSRDPRAVARRAQSYLTSTGIADQVFVGPEPEFYVFDDVRYGESTSGAFFEVNSEEASWNTRRDESGANLGYKLRAKGGYSPVAPSDTLIDVRNDMAETLLRLGVPVELHHHEVGSAGQCEIGVRFDTLLAQADQVLLFKYVVKNVARRHGRAATFMPKPMHGEAGSGMHTHQSLWQDGQPLFFDETGYGGLSDTARWYIGGLLRHAAALCAFTNPSANSYHRLVPGYEAPVNLVYSASNRSAAIRIPAAGNSPKSKRIEYRVPDPAANPYLAFSAMLMAGVDGVRNRIEPAAPVDKDLYELTPDELVGLATVPASLDAALDALEADHDFLLEGGVFTPDLIGTWLEMKRKSEVDALRHRPHPHEYTLYFDC